MSNQDITKPKSIQDIVIKFPFKTLPRIYGNLEYASLSEITRALYENTAFSPTTLRGGAHGHLRMIMKDTLYANIAATT